MKATFRTLAPTASLFATLALPAALLAHPPGMHGGMHAMHDDMFATMDANRDGRISAQEHADGAAKMFTTADANHDGYLTLDEMHAMHADRGNAMQSGMQAGHDHEAGASANAAAGKPAMAGMGHDDQMPASGGMHHDMMDDRFKSMDADGDGRLSAAEHAAGAAKMFTTADTNQDGSVSRAEFDAAHASMMGDHMHEEGMHEDKDHDHDRDDQPAHP